MLYGMYLSAQGAEAQSRRLDVIANNLSNASTTGFKRDLAVFQAHRPYDVARGAGRPPPGNLNASTGGISLADVVTDYAQGPIKPTGGTYDIALSGPGFLQVSDGEQQWLTRNGHLTVNERGELVTGNRGHRVLGASGEPITVPPEAHRVEIASDGSVYQVDERGGRSRIGRLGVVQPESPEAIEKLGNSRYRVLGNVKPAGSEVRVLQGHLESSGTRPVAETMQMIEASRAFETNINMIRYQDQSLGRLLQSAARR